MPAHVETPVGPEVDADLMPVWNAWHLLMGGRDVSSGEGLSWRECSRFCEDHGIEGDARRRWCRLLLAMDRVFVRFVNAPKEAEPDAGTSDWDRRKPGHKRGS